MLQKVDQARLDKVLSVIEKAAIRFPVATLAKGTGKSKGEVSDYLKGKKPMSDAFYRTIIELYEAAPIPIKNTDLNKQIGTIEERLMRLEGYTTVLFDTAVATLSQATGRQAATIRAELSEAVTMVLKHSLEELRKKGQES